MIGIRLMAKAGFHPLAAVSTFNKFQALERRCRRDIVPPMLRTHPLTSDRIACLRRDLPEAMALFRESGPLAQLWRRIQSLRPPRI